MNSLKSLSECFFLDFYFDFLFYVLYKNPFLRDSDNSHVDKVLAFSHTSEKYLILGVPSFNCRDICLIYMEGHFAYIFCPHFYYIS